MASGKWQVGSVKAFEAPDYSCYVPSASGAPLARQTNRSADVKNRPVGRDQQHSSEAGRYVPFARLSDQSRR